MAHQSERNARREVGSDILAVPITTQRHRAYASVNHPCPLVRVQSKSYGYPGAMSCEFHAVNTGNPGIHTGGVRFASV